MYFFDTVFCSDKNYLSEKTGALLIAYNREKKLLPELIVKAGNTTGQLYVYVKPHTFSHRTLPETQIRKHNTTWRVQTRINPVLQVIHGIAILFLLFSLLFFYNTPTVVISGLYFLLCILPTFLAAGKQHRKVTILVKEIEKHH